MASSSRTPYKVFISHAGEDKINIAFPLREKLLQHGITAFVDEKDMPGGTWSEQAMTTAMETTDIAVVVLSPEFVARKWPMKELLCFLRRCENPLADGRTLPVIIPLFYRLGIQELHEEPKFDRLDDNGNSLYRASRFFERMDNGEPEASVDNIQCALRKLHGARGVENYVEASNESTSTMLKRRNVLLNDLLEHVRDAVSTLSEEITPQPTGLESERTDFRSYYHEERSTSDLVLEFWEQDDVGNPTTVEGAVLQAVLDRSESASVMSIQGIGGVGKTSILRGLSCLDQVKQRFQNGSYLLSLGADATRNRMIEGLSKLVEDSGGTEKAKEIRQEKNWKKVLNEFRSWFAEKECLFMVDDVWETERFPSDIVAEIKELHLSGLNSKVLITTRSTEVASQRVKKRFKLEPREPEGCQCRAILMLHSDTTVDESNEEDKRGATLAVTEILRKCDGLPLFLKLAGRAINALSFEHGSIAYHLYSRTLDLNMQGWMNTDVESYRPLSSALSTSLDILEKRKHRWGFPVHLSTAEIQRRLSVPKKQSRVPMSMLGHLWELRSEKEACIVAREFEQIALATLYVKKVDSRYVEFLGVHDSLHEYALEETRRLGEETLGHQVLLKGYGQGLEKEEGCRAWWSTQLKVDEYAHRHICRHLASAGFTDELVSLLLKPEWTIRSFKVCGILDVERDYGLGIALAKKVGNADDALPCDPTNGACEIETALEMISEATRLSCGYDIGEPRELCFQLYGRLKMWAEENVVIKKYLNRLEEKGNKLWGPWLKSISSFLTCPGGATTRILPTADAHCMVVRGDGRFAYYGSWNRVVVVDVTSAEIVTEYISELKPNRIQSIALSRNEKLLYSFSCSDDNTEGTVDVWDTATGVCCRSFDVVPKICEAAEEYLFIASAVTDDGSLFLTFRNTNEVQVWNMETEQQQPEPLIVHVGHAVRCIAVMPGGEYVVSGGSDNMLRIWKAASGEQQGDAFVGHESEISCVSVMPDGLHLVSGSNDDTVRIWNIEKRTQVGMRSRARSGSIMCVAVSRDGRRVASGYPDGKILVGDVTAGREACKELVGHTENVTGVAFHPVDDTIISCSRDEIRFWDLNKKGPEASFDRHEDPVLSIAFSSDGIYAVTGSQDCSLRVWNARSGRQVGNPLHGHFDRVTGVAITPDDERIVSASWDRTVRVWDFQSRKLLQTFTYTTLIDSVAVTPSGGQAVTRSNDMTAQVWNLAEGDVGHFVLPPSHEYNEEPGRRILIPRNNDVFLSDDGLRAVVVFESEICVWTLEMRQLVKTVKVENRMPASLSRKEIMDLIGETYLESNVAFDITGNEIWYATEGKRGLLGILETTIYSWSLSPDKETLCVGLRDGQVVFMKLEM